MPLLLLLLKDFAASIRTKLSLGGSGEPEEQLRAPFEIFLQAVGKAFSMDIKSKGETYLHGIGKPDFSVHCNNALCGYVELKQPGKGADPSRYRGHDKRQWERFKTLPNILYTDGNEWALYQNGERVGRITTITYDITLKGAQAVLADDALDLEPILREFVTWNPIAPSSAKELAILLAPVCKLLRTEVQENMKEPDSPFTLLAQDWRKTLFPGATDAQFADAYAQTVTFALLLARAEGGSTENLRKAEQALAADHALLSKALKIFTDELNESERPISLSLLQRITANVSEAGWKDKNSEPWLYFYEDFLAEYDPQLRKDAGAYYTPVQAVRCMVRLTDELLRTRMGKTDGFASPGVMTLDPAAGTGTFPLGILAHSLADKAERMGPGAVAAYAETLARQLYGFEMLVGPYAVSQLRLSRSLVAQGASLPPGGPQVYLTDTLESPNRIPEFPSLLTRELSTQHRKAQEIKQTTPILVCIGNPPYSRHDAATDRNRKETGGWVRWGDEEENGKYREQGALLAAFSEPVKAAGLGNHLKNLYNLYVYFWRWALWKVFEQKKQTPGVISFITASSFLTGPAFCGMREHMRTLCDEIWIVDLGGEGRGGRKEENIFNIQTPVCITIAVRYEEKNEKHGAAVHYTRISGSREEKLAELNSIISFSDMSWRDCHAEGQRPFKPIGNGDYFSNPLLTDLLPWQHSGIQFKRTWPIGHEQSVLQKRWRNLLAQEGRETMFKETRDRKASHIYPHHETGQSLTALTLLPADSPPPTIVRYGYRSFDRQWCLLDNRLGDYLRPPLLESRGTKQIYFASIFTQPLSSGPALTLSVDLPDMHFFSGRGAKDIIPLYRDAAATQSNILPGLLELLSGHYGTAVNVETFSAYLYAILAHKYFTDRFYEDLDALELRVPLTKDAHLFSQVATLGKRLIWLHSYGERMVPEGQRSGVLPPGSAKCLKHIPGTAEAYPESYSYNSSTATLQVGHGEFGPIEQDVYEFEVSGLKVVQSWLNYRMKAGSGRTSSPLDAIRPELWTSEFTSDLLNLLWILEATLQSYPAQRDLLDNILNGELFTADELPAVPEEYREAPTREKARQRQCSLL